jgi:hypothetical protein
MLAASAWCQQAPVTRAEFAELFAAVARGYLASEDHALPDGFKKDDAPVKREEVAQAMVLVAVGKGKVGASDGSAIETLKLAKVMESHPDFFSYPGENFRPADLIAALVAFSDGISARNKPQSADDKRLTTPKIGR